MKFNKFALGTANFGMDYGTFNTSGQVTINQIEQITAIATVHKFDTLDTAIAYGESDSMLGSVGVTNWKVVTKLPAVPDDVQDVSRWIYLQVQSALDRLKIPSIYGLLLHQPHQLNKNRGLEIWSTLRSLKEKQIVSKIGYSIYDAGELDNLWINFEADIVQAPFNLIDRRMYTSGWLDLLYRQGCEIHIRSIFLQGLLLSNLTNRSTFFKTWTPLWKSYIKWLKKEKLTPLQACLAFATSFPQVAKIIIGVDTLAQLEQIVECKIPSVVNFPEDISTRDTNLLNPSKWRIL